ncbi:hypothetical protein K3X44_09590 [Aliiroseovarius crassostreae]|uniref:hypothetical protein n=1 Tax=Aliiroseovarius crassostreae TaxID=154981 RepID=UPI002207063A|nr:hypothetical protein [Aliiroseovarius crassostreae]UWQ00777.1 hypothetical protein K3X44_09590 [Aliiroseovarius crassostreae]
MKRIAILLTFILGLTEPTFAGVVPNEKCAFTVASRKTLAEVRSYIATRLHPSHKPYLRVAKTQNGWFAISVGDVPKVKFSTIKSRLVRKGEVPRDSFCSSGKKYTRIIPRHEYLPMGQAPSTRRSPSKRRVNCKQYNREISACYALTLGPKACTQYVSEKRIPGANTFAERVAISSACTAGTNASFAKSFLPSDVMGVIIDETLETGCDRIDSDNVLAQLFIGLPFCVTNAVRWASKIDASNACAREVERACR